MTDLHSSPGTGRFEVRVTADTHFGWLRTRLSVERTMMSWIRTAVSLIGFGFAIVQFLDVCSRCRDWLPPVSRERRNIWALRSFPAECWRFWCQFGNTDGRFVTCGRSHSSKSLE